MHLSDTCGLSWPTLDKPFWLDVGYISLSLSVPPSQMQRWKVWLGSPCASASSRNVSRLPQGGYVNSSDNDGGGVGLQTHRAKYNIMSHECERGLLSPSSE